jgi:hypothetical protein
MVKNLMTVGALKRILVLVNVAAVLGLGGTAYAFLSHCSAMGQPYKPPSFTPPPVLPGARDVSKIDSIPMPLGRYPVKTATPEAATVEEPTVALADALREYGEILQAFAFEGPYEEGGVQPSITFKRKSGETVTIRRGDALETRPNPVRGREKHFPVPHRYRFIGCEADPEHPGGFYFLFDMKCDGTDIQKARWRREEESRAPRENAAIDIAASTDVFLGEEPAEPVATAKAEARPEERPAAPAETAPAPEPPPVAPVPAPTPGFDEELFVEEDGRLGATQEAVDYLRDNYQEILKDARTKSYVDPGSNRQRGIQVLSIARGSAANRFGIRPDDVILSINGRPVTRQAQAVNVVKEELRQNKNVIEVKLLRNGETITKTYDTRDPATRRAARDATRNRR